MEDNILRTLWIYLQPLWGNRLHSYYIRWNNAK